MVAGVAVDGPRFVAAAREELARQGHLVTRRDDGTGYASAGAPVRDREGKVRFVLSIIGTQASLRTEQDGAEMTALLQCAARAMAALGG